MHVMEKYDFLRIKSSKQRQKSLQKALNITVFYDYTSTFCKEYRIIHKKTITEINCPEMFYIPRNDW